MTKINIFLTSMLLLLLASLGNSLQSQTQIYYQNFNLDSSGQLPQNWTNTGGCNWISSTVNPSSGYAGASGGRNIWANCSGTQTVMVSGIVTIGYSSIVINWGGNRAASQTLPLTLEWSPDGSTWNNVTYTDVSNNGVWALVSSITLPAGAENQANLRFRWSVTNPSDYRFDDFRVTGMSAASKLYITNILGSQCIRPQTGIPFSVTVQSRDFNNNPVNVTTPTGITLSSTPSGLTGNLTGTIAINTNSVTISGVLYNSYGTITITASATSGMTLTSFTTGPIVFNAPSTSLTFNNLNTSGTVNNIHPPFSVSGVPADTCFSGSVHLVQVSGPAGGLTGTLILNASGGAAYFNDIVFTQVGTYQIKATSLGLTDAPTTTIVIVPGVPSLTEIKIPRNMNGTGTSSNNLFNAFLVQIQNLTPGATYRYFNSAVNSSDGNTFAGVGNVIYVDAPNGAFTRTTSPGLSFNYGSFTADNNGRYRGWFMIEPNSDSRFTPGAYVKYRIILNDGAGGSTPQVYLTTTQQVKVLDWTTSTNGGSFFDVSSGTGTALQPKNFLLAYNGDTSGTSGRPEFINVIENDGLSASVSAILPAYITSVEGQNSHCGIQIPDNLISGITLFEERTLVGGVMMNITSSGDVRSSAYSANGIWPPGVSTVNATNGMNAISIHPNFSISAISNISTVASEYKLFDNYPNPFNPTTKIKFSVPTSGVVKMTIYDILGQEIYTLVNGRYSTGSYVVDFNASNLPSGVYFYKLEAGDYVATKKMVLVK